MVLGNHVVEDDSNNESILLPKLEIAHIVPSVTKGQITVYIKPDCFISKLQS